MVFGDFNQVLGQAEKRGGILVTYSQIQRFQEAVQENELPDLGFMKHEFTWTKNQAGDNSIQERLDRALATIDWKDAFPKAVVHHFQRYRSDHCPIMVNILGEKKSRRKKPHIYKFEEMWLQDNECKNVVNIS